MNSIAQFEDRASSRRSKHEGESSTALCDRLSRTRDTSQRQLPADQDYAVSTREYQTDQSSLKPAPAAAGPVLEKRQKQQQRQKQPHRCAAVDRVTPYQSGSMIAVPQRSVPHPCGFFLSQGWEAAIAGYSISGSGLKEKQSTRPSRAQPPRPPNPSRTEGRKIAQGVSPGNRPAPERETKSAAKPRQKQNRARNRSSPAAFTPAKITTSRLPGTDTKILQWATLAQSAAPRFIFGRRRSGQLWN